MLYNSTTETPSSFQIDTEIEMFRTSFLLVAILVAFAVGCENPSTNSPTNGNAASPAKSQDKIALISITSEPEVDLQEVNMGLTFAGFCADEGYDVNIFLNVKGVKLATHNFPESVKFKNHRPLKQQLMDLSGRGVQVHVCPVCMKDFEIPKDEIIPEAFVTDKPKLFGKLGPNTVVFTY